GWAARRGIPRGPPASMPNSAARSEPAASRTAFRSSTRVSSVGRGRTRSDRPVPRLSSWITRANSASERRKSPRPGRLQLSSMWETKPGTKTRSRGPAPKAWYAIETSPLSANRVSGMSVTELPQLLSQGLREGLHLELLPGHVGEQLIGGQAVPLGPELAEHPAGLAVGEPV